MRIYLPFADGSSVSFDGTGFKLHKKPVVIEEDADPAESMAEHAWHNNWHGIARALENAWKAKDRSSRDASVKSVYGRQV